MVSSSSSIKSKSTIGGGGGGGRRNWKEIGFRVVNGLSLVAKEFVKRSAPAAGIIIGEQEATTSTSTSVGIIETLIRSTAKKALVSATDLAGLTKGSLISISTPIHTNNTCPPTPNEQQQHHPLDSQKNLKHNNTPHEPSSSSSSSVVYFHNHNEQQHHPPLSSSSSDDDDKNNCDAATATNTSSSSVAAHPVIPTTTSINNNVPPAPPSSAPITTTPPRKPRERRVPATPFSRALGFAGLGAGLAWGTLQESAKRLAFGSPPPGNNPSSALSPFLSDKNAERLALALCRMRGAALKIGQMLSIQDESLVPPPILAALEIVRQGADVMPRNQLNQVLDAELGNDWSSKLTSFDYDPIAAASIGQVHRAVTKDGLQIAMKIQYPGVANSIDSDIENVKLLLNYTNLIPKGLYLDRAIKVAKEELSRECDYLLEAKNQKHFRDLVSGTEGFYVPVVVDDLSSKRVLTSELVAGIPIDKVALLDQETRNCVGKRLLELTLLELFVFRFMQTDPNWGNFLYDETRKTLNLIDFGAARDYPKSFVDNYLRMVVACANGDRNAIIEMSCRLGFLSGEETEIMLDAHVQAGLVVGLPFSKAREYDFRSANITQSLSNLGATMLKHRLRPPPDEAYSLHRKLSGAFLACIKLGAVVPCRELLFQVYENHQFGEDNGEVVSSGLAS